MKKRIVALSICVGVSVFAQDAVVKPSAEKEKKGISEDRVATWVADTKQAKAEAAKYDLPILLLYTAPSWCSYCKKLENEILAKDEFMAYANKNLVLLIADYSDRAEGATWGEQNKDLLETCPIQGYPQMYLLSSAAANLGSVQFYEPEWSIQDYLDKIEMLQKSKPAQ